MKKAQVAIREEERADRGAAAEEQIGEILDGLGEGFEVIHDVETPYGNIDHLVIGQHCGIVLIETKSHHGKVSARGDQLLVNGRLPEKDFIRQSLRNTYWLRQVVEFVTKDKAWITPVIVFTNAFVEVSGTIKGVHVVNVRFLERFLHSHAEADTSVWEAKEEIKSLLIPHAREDPSVCIYQG